jgi:hypothetical protein
MKRFGRNQKRAMRAQVDELTVKLKAANELEALLRHNMRINQEAVEATAAILGRHFAGLSPETMQVDEIRDGYRMPSHRQADAFDPYASAGELVMADLIYLETNEARLQVNEISDAMHLRYETPMGDVAYALSAKAWHLMPDRELHQRLHHEIARDLARLLVKFRNAKVAP